MPHHVVALALPGVVPFDLATVAQVFGHADEPEYTFRIATVGGGPVRTSTGFEITGGGDLTTLAHAQTVIVPGFRPCTHPLDDAALEALRTARTDGARIASVCTGAFALAAAGLLDGLSATTHWQDTAQLRAAHPAIDVQPDVLYIDHGQIATSAGVAAGIDLCLHLVRRDHGQRLANSIARRMVVPPHRAGGQAQFVTAVPAPSSPRDEFAALLDWALGNLDRSLTVTALSRRAHLSERQLTRRFIARTGRTPLQWLLHQRVLAAMELLETTDFSLETIATRTGFGTAATMRRQFSRQIGTAPSAYRRTFAGSRLTR